MRPATVFMALCVACLWAALILAVGCSTLVMPPTPQQVVEDACKRALADLQRDKANGYSCSEAKARADQAEPRCHLHFHCGGDAGVTDGGSE